MEVPFKVDPDTEGFLRMLRLEGGVGPLYQARIANLPVTDLKLFTTRWEALGQVEEHHRAMIATYKRDCPGKRFHVQALVELTAVQRWFPTPKNREG
ncbi:hypothetical protein LCGC14_0897420 [marine sediment metagenome]|uniref:Uncharacterized protein n=1 Tax=marine sediment metagenome TaxID=412755 RepID=A0A0F9RGG8_9ZZZZ